MADVSERDKSAEIAASQIINVLNTQYPAVEWPCQAIANIVDTAIAAALAEQRNEFIALARNPYGDEVQAMAGDEPRAVGEKIAAAAIRGGKAGE